MAARRVKIDFGDKPTAWSDETTEWQGASRLIDLDYAQASSNLLQKSTALEAAQKAFLKTPGLSLFNYL